MAILTNPTVDMVLSLCAVMVLVIGLVLLLDSIWRVEQRFDRYLKLMALVFALLVIRMILIILGFSSFVSWPVVARLIDLTMSILFLVAQINLFAMVRSLDGEASDEPVS